MIKKIVLTLALLVPSMVSAAPLTNCSGSWDGPGMTACELLGVPGVVGTEGYDFSRFSSFTVLYEITALDQNNWLMFTGSTMLYFTGEQAFNTQFNPNQFAIWEDENKKKTRLGVEDMIDGDFDYNDYIVEFTTEDVPEPVSIAMLGIGLFFVARRKNAPARLQ